MKKSLIMTAIVLCFASFSFGMKVFGVNNAADGSYWNFVAPGEIISIYGSDLLLESRGVSADHFPLPKVLRGLSVRLGGQAIPLLYVSRNQINAQVPDSFHVDESGRTTIQVCYIATEGLDYEKCSNIIRPLRAYLAPALFSYNDESGKKVVIVQSHTSHGYGLVSSSSPAVIYGDDNSYHLIFWGTGFGPAKWPAKLGNGEAAPGYDEKSLPVEKAVSGLIMAVVSMDEEGRWWFSLSPEDVSVFAAPGYAGVDQINVKLPGYMTPGEHKIRLRVYGAPIVGIFYLQ